MAIVFMLIFFSIWTVYIFVVATEGWKFFKLATWWILLICALASPEFVKMKAQHWLGFMLILSGAFSLAGAIEAHLFYVFKLVSTYPYDWDKVYPYRDWAMVFNTVGTALIALGLYVLTRKATVHFGKD